MKGKFRILGHIGIGVLLVCALMLAFIPAPVSAATAVTSVKVDFPFSATPPNKTGTTEGNEYYIYFKPTTALVRGIDYVTVTFPDGTATMSGTAGTGYAFTVTSADKLDVQFSTDYGTLGADATWYKITDDGTVGGYRVKVKVPIDIAAGTGVWVKFDPDATDSVITSASTAGVSYKVYVQTTKDTTPVLSSAFSLGSDAVDALVVTPLVTTAGVSTQYIAAFTPSTEVGIGGTVTLKFPLGTTMPTSISTSDVLFSANGTDYSNSTAATVDTDLRTVTGTTPIALSASTSRMKILSSAGVANPQIAATTSYYCMVSTSTDAWWYQEASGRTHGAGSATKVLVANGEIGEPASVYSDNATMINMLSSYIYVTMADQYGNAKAVTGGVTVSLSSSSGTGTFYVNDNATPGSGTYSSATSITVDAASPADAGQQVYYKDTAAGTHTLTFSADTYTSATWTFQVCSGVSLYDSSNNLINTYGASSTSPVAEINAGSGTIGTTQKYGVDYINDAITASMAGDTVKLGDGIYEVDTTAISVSKAITLTSVNGAASTTIRNVGAEIDKAIEVTGTGTATTPIIIEQLTFTRLRATLDIDCAIRNTAGDYVTVQNCVFSYIIPDEGSATEAVVWFQAGSRAITSCTISNNTFSNCVGFNAISDGDGRTGCIVFDNGGSSYNMTGVTVSGNTLTNCNDYGIAMGAGSCTVKATVSNNTITNGYSSIDLAGHSDDVSVTGNTITGAYNYGVLVELGNNAIVTIKNNTITGCAGTNGAIRIPDETDAVVTVQYNDITGTNSEGYAIKADHAAPFDCRYNWYGDASGPNYTALTGATVAKSNPNGTGDKISDYVTYYPWLHKSRADVVADNASYQTSNMKLVSGWNTLSTPVPLITAADTVQELIPSGMTIGYYYDGGWTQITTAYTLSPCDAVYVKMSAATYVQLKLDAKTFSTPSKDLDAGWNLASLAALDSNGMDADDAVASVAKTAANLPGYAQVVSPSINANRYDMYYNTGTSWTVSYGQTEVTEDMFAGLGYWIYMQNAATLAGFEITPIAPDLD